MKQKEMSYVLKAIDAITVAACLALMFLVLPQLAQLYIGLPGVASLYWPFLVIAWLGFLPILALAAIAWQVFTEIGRDNSFSRKNAARLRVMGYLAAADIVVWLAGLVFVASGGVAVFGIMLSFAVAMAISVILAVVCVSLSHLTAKAAALKAENDLTV